MIKIYSAFVAFLSISALLLVDGTGFVSEHAMNRLWGGAFGLFLTVVGGWVYLSSHSFVKRRKPYFY